MSEEEGFFLPDLLLNHQINLFTLLLKFDFHGQWWCPVGWCRECEAGQENSGSCLNSNAAKFCLLKVKIVEQDFSVLTGSGKLPTRPYLERVTVEY